MQLRIAIEVDGDVYEFEEQSPGFDGCEGCEVRESRFCSRKPFMCGDVARTFGKRNLIIKGPK